MMHGVDNQISLEEEKSLVTRAKKDREAFGELYGMYFQRIYNYILHRTGNVDLTEDLTSQVFMKVLDNIEKFEWRGLPFSAWLYRIASNEIASHFRKSKPVSNVDLSELEFLAPDEEESIHEKMVGDVEKESLELKYSKVKELVDKLKPKYAEIIVLKFFEKKSNLEISQILDVTEGNLRIRLFRALKILKKLINEKE